jgi:hypothetical protein
MSLTDTLAGIVGAAHVITDPDVLDGRSVDHTGRYRGHASRLRIPDRQFVGDVACSTVAASSSG